VTGIAAKYAKSYSIALKAGLEYRVNFYFSVAAAAAPVIIQTALWIALYGQDPGASLFGFTFPQMVAYTVIAQLVSRLVRTGFEYDINNDIRTGSLDRYLVKPVSYFSFRFFAFLGDKTVHSAVTGALLAGAVAVLSLVLGFTLVPVRVLLFLAALALAFALNFLIFWCVSLAGFWLTEIGFLFEAARIVIIAASGGIFPLAVFGPAGEALLGTLPFRFTIQFPAELLLGRVRDGGAGRGFLLATLWIAALFGLSRLLWARGVRRFAAVGS